MYGWKDSGDSGAQLFKRIREQQRITAATRARMDRIASEQAFLDDFEANLATYAEEIDPAELRSIFGDFLRLTNVHWNAERKQAFFKRTLSLQDSYRAQRAWNELAAEIATLQDTLIDGWGLLTASQQKELVRQLEARRAEPGNARTSGTSVRKLNWGEFFKLIFAAAAWALMGAIFAEYGAAWLVLVAIGALILAFYFLLKGKP